MFFFDTKKEKADATSLDEQNIMNEYFAMADKDSFLFEKCESFVWGMDGDVNPKRDIKNFDTFAESKDNLFERIEVIHKIYEQKAFY